MAAYGDLLTAIQTAYTDAGYTIAPSGPDPLNIPANGADSWVAIDFDPRPAGTNSDGRAMESHDITVSAITARTARDPSGQATALDLALSLRGVLDKPTVLGSVAAHAEPEEYTIETAQGAYVVSVTFAVRSNNTIP